MRILDRYVFSEFIKPYITGIFVFIFIFVVGLLVEKIDFYVENKVPLEIVLLYYLYQTPYIAVLMSPVAVMLSTLFSLGDLSTNNEVTVMKSGGLSVHRIASPLLFASFLISVLIFLFGETFVPECFRTVKEIENKYIYKIQPSPELRDVKFMNTNNRITIIKVYNLETKIMQEIMISKSMQDGQLSTINADSAVWKGNRWEFYNYVERDSNQSGVTTLKQAQKYNYAFGLNPDQLFTIVNPDKPKAHEISIFTLYKNIRITESAGWNAKIDWVNFHTKISFPFVNFIICLFGIPLSFRTYKSGKAANFGLCLLICFIYWGCIATGISFGNNGTISPTVAPWIGNILFFLIGVTMIVRTRS